MHKSLYFGCAEHADVYILFAHRSTSVFGDRTRSSWKRRLFPSVSVPDDDAAGSVNADALFAADLPSGQFEFALIFCSTVTDWL